MFAALQSTIVDLLEAGGRAMGKTHPPGQPFFSATPRGVLTGHTSAGVHRFRSNFSGKALKYSLGIGAGISGFSMAKAPRGHFASAGAQAASATSGSILGAAVGGLMLGLPGEWIGGALGGVAGEKIGAVFQPLAEFGRNQVRMNFGTYEDSQPAWTMRQVAAREISQSLLNARQYLGKEALLLHS